VTLIESRVLRGENSEPVIYRHLIAELLPIKDFSKKITLA